MVKATPIENFNGLFTMLLQGIDIVEFMLKENAKNEKTRDLRVLNLSYI